MRVEARVEDPWTPGPRNRLVAVGERRIRNPEPLPGRNKGRWYGVRAEVVSGGSFYRIHVEAAAPGSGSLDLQESADTWHEAESRANDLLRSTWAQLGVQ